MAGWTCFCQAYSGAHAGAIDDPARRETIRLVFTSMNEDSDPPAPVRVTFTKKGRLPGGTICFNLEACKTRSLLFS